jgi:uncharacterized repeat protein (TIGR01451 family)
LARGHGVKLLLPAADVATAQPVASQGQGAMAMSGPTHTYNIGELGPHESRTITVTGTPSQAGKLDSCTSVIYNPTLCTTAMVTNPQMKILKEAVGSANGDMCEPQTLRYTLTNTGSGDLSGVRVEDQLPAGLAAPDGSQRISFNVGSLAQGQSRAFEVKVKPQHAGNFASAATASADDGVTARSDAASLAVKAPRLQITLSSPNQKYLGDQVSYHVTVKNIGDAPARNTTVAVNPGHPMEEGAQPAAATGGLDVGQLAPGDSKSFDIPLSARNEGDFHVNAVASDPCAGQAFAAGTTRVVGTPPGIQLNTVDDHDPVRIGDNVTYTITVLNQGMTADRNVHVTATIPDGEKYVSSSGSSEATVSGNKITFAPVPTLGGKQTATWTVTTKALNPGDVQFKVDMSSQSFPNAAHKAEPTRLY